MNNLQISPKEQFHTIINVPKLTSETKFKPKLKENCSQYSVKQSQIYVDDLYLPDQKWKPESTYSKFKGCNPKLYHQLKQNSKPKNISYFRNILNFSKHLLTSYRDNNSLEKRINKTIQTISSEKPLVFTTYQQNETENALSVAEMNTTKKDSIIEFVYKKAELSKNDSKQINLNKFESYYKNLGICDTISSYMGTTTTSTNCRTFRGNETINNNKSIYFKEENEKSKKPKRDHVNNLLFTKNELSSFKKTTPLDKRNFTFTNTLFKKSKNFKQIIEKEINVLDNIDIPKNGYNYKIPDSYGETKKKLETETMRLLLNHKTNSINYTTIDGLANYGEDILSKIEIVNYYLSLQKPSLFIPKYPRNKIVFVILDGTVVLSKKHISGVYVEIPSRRSLSFSHTKKERLEKYYQFLQECQDKLKLKLQLKSIFLLTSIPIFDLIDIPVQDSCVYVSTNNIFHGIHLFNEKHLSKKKDKLNEQELNLLQFKPASKAHQEKFDLVKFIRKRKKKIVVNNEIYKRIKRFKKTKKEKQKYLNEQSFTFKPEEDEEWQEEWKYLSDNESRKKKSVLFCEDFFKTKNQLNIYIFDNQMKDKISELKRDQRIKFRKFLNQRQDENTLQGIGKLVSIYNLIKARRNKTFYINSINIIKKDKQNEMTQDEKDIRRNATQVMKLFLEKMKIFRKKDSSRIQFNTNLFYGKNKAKENNKYIINNIKDTMDMYYHADHRTEKQYPDLISFHIPNLLLQFPKLKRRELYETFAEFKTLLKICLSMNRKFSLIKEGIDFDTFFNCNLQINSQGKALAKKIFNAINTLNSKYINWNEYMKGILTLRNKDLNDKLDLFLNIIDEDGNGNLSFEEVYTLSIESLSRNLKQKNNDIDDEVVNVLADFFARLIFELVGKPITEEIPIDVIKEKIMQGGKAAKYLEMFICADNFT